MEFKNLEGLKDEINHLEEAEELLHELYYGFGPYEIHAMLQEHKKDFFPTDVNQLIGKLDNHFNFDDSE